MKKKNYVLLLVPKWKNLVNRSDHEKVEAHPNPKVNSLKGHYEMYKYKSSPIIHVPATYIISSVDVKQKINPR